MLKLNRAFILACLLGLSIMLGSCNKNDEISAQKPAPQPIVDPLDSSRVLVSGGYCVLGDAPGGWGNYDFSGADTLFIAEFYLDRYEVTNLQYAVYLDSAYGLDEVYLVNDDVFDAPQDGHLLLMLASDYSHVYFANDEDLFEAETGFEQIPVVMVSWYGANAFADFYGKRLPTEFEWEKAARGTSGFYAVYSGVGAGYIYPWGNEDPDPAWASFKSNFNAPEAATAYPAGMSWFGAYNMAGNVSEWTATVSGSAYIHRGGSFVSQPDYLRTGARMLTDPLTTDRTIGFRCASNP